MKSVLSFILFFIISIISLSTHAHDNPGHSKSYYEDYFTFKKGKTFSHDPYVWAYTNKFAERFSMPKIWIDENLKGMIAVAFRMTTVGTLNCGYGKNENSCWPPVKCQMDIYYDKKIKLPWTREDIRSDLIQRGLYSTDYLHYQKIRGIREYKRYIGGAGVLESGGVIKFGNHQSSPARLNYFDRDFASGIGIISYTGLGVCPKVIDKGYMHIYNKETSYKLSRAQLQHKNAKAMHTFEFSKEFMKRANIVYKQNDKSNIDVTNRLLKQFKNSRD